MRFKLISILVILSLFIANASLNLPAQAAASGLFISEYVEGSSNNKALEIYNGTGAAVDLAAGGYTIQMFFNGSASPGLTISLAGSIANGDVFVLVNSLADPAVLALADQIASGGWFNGDDAVVLSQGGTVLDVIGQIGFDPGTEWGSGLVSTGDNTLRRMATICTGDPVGSDAFDPAIEWTGYAQNTFDGLGAHSASCARNVTINEFSASTTGNDVEYVEIYGEPNTVYNTYQVLEIEGDTTTSGAGVGVVDEVIPVGTTDSSGFWLQNLPVNALENGTITLLLVKGFTGALGADLDTNNDGVFDAMPWDSIVDSVAVNDGGVGDVTYGVPSLGPNYDGVSSFAPGGASRFPDGLDSNAASDWVRNDFDLAGIPGFPGTIGLGEAYNTPGMANQIYVPPPEACGDPTTPIYTIQGSGADSPFIGVEVATEGVVVGDFEGPSPTLRGFNIQDPAGDVDPATSDGLFIFNFNNNSVAVGDFVRVRGTVSEFNGLTEITATKIWVCSTGAALAPTELILPVSSLTDFERFEGMLVTFPQTLYISEYFNFDRYGEIVLTSERQYQPTSVYEPGSPEAAALAQANPLGRITLDDARTNQNPNPAIHPNGSIFNLSNLFRGGDTLQSVTGIMSYSFGLYRIQPTQGALYTGTNPRPLTPDPVGGHLKVASFNVLNYFTTLNSRGANTPEEFTRQRDKIFAALAEIDADIVGLIEIENNDAAIQDLVSGLNALLGAPVYAYVDTGAFGTDEIKVAFIYKPASVSLVGSYAILDSTVDPRFNSDYNRPALAQTFISNSTGGIFTVVVNHLKSKGSNCNAIGDPDLGDGAGNCNRTRTLAALALVDWLALDPTGSGDSDFLIIGDLNSYDKEDPIDALVAGGYTDLLDQFGGEYAYSYVFDGQLGYLDHALAGVDLLDEVSGAAVWHINADEPDLIDYDMTFKEPAQDALYEPNAYRSSDHDPVLVGLTVCDEIAPTLSVSVSPDTLWTPNHKVVEVMATIVASDNFDPDPTITLLSVTSNEPDDEKGDGMFLNDIVIVDDTHFLLRAERSALGSGRTYTITYQVTDDCGNSTIASVTVFVPLNQGN
jgi:hypothetical protein